MNGRRTILALATALITALLLVACGHTGRRLPSLNLHPNTVSLSDALAQLDALPKPEGVDAKLWNELKSTLKSALATNNHRPTARLGSTPPTGDANHVTDFGITDHGDGSYSLSWHYRNLGDYDQNGVVGVSDITPLAQHFGETYVKELETNTIQAVVDGDGSGKVGIEDVTQIAMYFGVSCVGYSLRTSDILPTFVSDADELDVISLSFAQGEGRYEFGVEHALPSHSYIAVAPIDTEGAYGVLSNIVQTQNHNPVAALTVDPTEGDAPLTVGLDAGESSDMDGPIAKYEWDFEGDGVWDEDSGTLSYVEHVYDTPDFYYPAVRVTDDEGATATAEASVFAGQWRISTAVTNLFPLAGATSLELVNGSPAMCFYARILDVPGEYYFYVRANDALGETWSAPTCALDIFNPDMFDDTLAIVNGRPAVAVMDAASSKIYYSRSEDENGVAWGQKQEVCMAGPSNNNLSMAIVNGMPAIAFSRPQLRYVRALDPNGSSWGTPVQVVSEGYEPSLAVVSGVPAISFINSGNELFYVRANDSEGNTWGEPITVTAEVEYSGTRGNSLAMVNGYPAISYLARLNDGTKYYHLRYIRAGDYIGNTWGQPKTLDDENGLKRWPTSLAVINGRPAIAYDAAPPSTTDLEVRYIWARDASGSSWGNPVKLDDGYYCSLKELFGSPAVAYIHLAPSGETELGFALYR